MPYPEFIYVTQSSEYLESMGFKVRWDVSECGNLFMASVSPLHNPLVELNYLVDLSCMTVNEGCRGFVHKVMKANW